jgi:hypothetical protein
VKLPPLTLRLFYRLLLTASALPALCVLLFALRGETDATARLLLTVVAALFASVAIAVWSRHIVAVYVQIIALSVLTGVYLFELGRSDPIDQKMHTEQFWQLIKSNRAAGKPVTIQFSPANFLQGYKSLALADGTRVLPLAGVADLPTIMCREGPRPFAEYVADEHGFNNPKGVWGKPADLVFIGDSMTYGACLPERDHFIGQIRRRYPATLNLGNGGIGPLFYLAIAREFLPAARPKYVFYMYDENNDIYFVNVPGRGDVVTEYGHDILRQYLEDDVFSQRSVERRDIIHDALKQLVEGTIVAGLSARTPGKQIAKVLGLSQTRAGLRGTSPDPLTPLAPPRVQSAPPTSLALHQERVWRDADAPRPHAEIRPVGFDGNDRAAHRHLAQQVGVALAPRPAADFVEVFKTVFAKTLGVVNASGARLVFVNIPAQVTVCDGVTHPWMKPVLDFVAQTGVDTIDLEKDFRNAMLQHGREQVFAVAPCGGHFSELGYKVIGDRLLQYLSIRDELSATQPAVAGKGWSRRSGGTEHQAEGAVSPSDQLLYAGTDLSEPELVAARRADAERWRRQRPNIAARAIASAADWTTARLATRMVFRHQQVYTADAPVDRVMKTDGSIVTDRDGAAIMGYSWQPKAASSIARIKVVVPAWSEAQNGIVAALFLDGQPEPRALSSQQLAPGRARAAVIDVDIATRAGQAITVVVQVAPSRPGVVYLNSDRNPPIPGLSKPTLTIAEYAPFWHR